jgi:hypothetical protein
LRKKSETLGHEPSATSAFQSGSAGDDLDKLGGDGRLARPVVAERQPGEHVAGVPSGVVHGGHPGAHLAGGVLQQAVVEHGGHLKLCEVHHDVALRVVALYLVVVHLADLPAFLRGEHVRGQDGRHRGKKRHGGLELVEHDLQHVVLVVLHDLVRNHGTLREIDPLILRLGKKLRKNLAVLPLQLRLALISHQHHLALLRIALQLVQLRNSTTKAILAVFTLPIVFFDCHHNTF